MTIEMLKNAHLRRFPLPSSLQRTLEYASLLRISGALHLGIFEHPGESHFFCRLSCYCYTYFRIEFSTDLFYLSEGEQMKIVGYFPY